MKINFTALQGELLAAHAQRLIDMHTDKDSINYEEYYFDMRSVIADIHAIHSLDSLSKFCDDYGLNSGIFEGLSFPELISKYYK